MARAASRCRRCKSDQTKIWKTRTLKRTGFVRRHYVCLECGTTWRTKTPPEVFDGYGPRRQPAA